MSLSAGGRKQAELICLTVCNFMLCIKPELQNKSFTRELSVKRASQDEILIAAKISEFQTRC